MERCLVGTMKVEGLMKWWLKPSGAISFMLNSWTPVTVDQVNMKIM